MTTDIEKAREAVAAILQAREKCIEAGVPITATAFRHALSREDDAFIICANLVKVEITRAEHRAKPIAVGDLVRVRSVYNEVDRFEKILCVGSRLVKLVRLYRRANYRLDTGFWNSPSHGSNCWIDPDDLYRIRRDLMKKGKKRSKSQRGGETLTAEDTVDLQSSVRLEVPHTIPPAPIPETDQG
mgnify:CR=1 FL=1